MGFPAGYQSGCPEVRLNRPGRRSDIAAVVHVSTRPRAVGQHRNAFPEDSFRLSPKVPSASQPLRPITGSADNAGIETKIRCLKKRKAPALGRRLVMPVDDLGTPSPHEGSICCEKETDRFSICYGDDVSVRRE